MKAAFVFKGLKAILFCYKKKQGDSASNFPECRVLVWSKCFKLPFQNQCPLILLSPFLNLRSGSIKWQANIVTYFIIALGLP